MSGDTTRGFVIGHPRPRVAQLTLNNPPANALTLEMRTQISQAWRKFEDDDDVRVVVVNSSSSTHFSTGLDLAELIRDLESHSPEERHFIIDQFRWGPRDAGLTKPVIAVIDGFCLAGGLHLAQMCDLRIASHDAVFGIPEGRWSYPATFAWELARSLPMNLVLEMLMFPNRRFSATRMYEIGFLNAVESSSNLFAKALSWADELAEMPISALKAHKRLINETALPDWSAMRELAPTYVRDLYLADEQRTLLKTFEKSKPTTS